jgi:2'-5' RNA ligase
MRLFFAVELPLSVRGWLARLQPTEADRAYRWVDPSSMHVTLVFLGQQPAEQLEVLTSVGGAAAQGSRALKLRLGQPSSFGPRKAPRVLWIGLDGELPPLHDLRSRLDGGLRRAGFSLEERLFSPHITLARRRESARPGVPPNWPPAQNSGASEFEITHLTLFESRLSPRGATYIALGVFPLGG